jgi:hypothetical protein
VPPPPVAGATVGNEVAEGVGVADGLALGVAEGVADALALGVAERLTEVLALGVAEGLAEAVNDAEAVPGDSFGSVALGADPEHAATDTEATIGTAAQPTTVSLAPNPVRAVVVRIFIGSLRRLADGGAFRVATKENPICCTYTQWPIDHSGITLRE